MLAELQRTFAAALRDVDAPPPALIARDGLAATRRLAVYRNHLFTSLTEALAASYPVVRTLVDPRFFGYAAHSFIAAAPPADPCIAAHGAGFADYLASFPPCRQMPWLADVARFEWAQVQVLANPVLATVAPAALTAAHGLRLQPSLSLFASPWPVDLVWQANQGPRPGEPVVDLDAGAIALRLWRAGRQVLFRRIEPGEHALLGALADGQALTEATATALAADPLFDLLLCLRRLLGDGLIVAATPAPETDR